MIVIVPKVSATEIAAAHWPRSRTTIAINVGASVVPDDALPKTVMVRIVVDRAAPAIAGALRVAARLEAGQHQRQVRFLEEMIELAYRSDALTPERLALRDAPPGPRGDMVTHDKR